MRNQEITNDRNPLQLVWVFQGDDLPERRSHHPSAVFTSLKAASKWVKAYRLSGLITGYMLDVPAFEYSARIGGVPDRQRDGELRQVWRGGEMHYHVKDGVVLEAPDLRRKRVAQLVAVPYTVQQEFNARHGADNDLAHIQAVLERMGFDEIQVLHDPAAAEVVSTWEETVSGLKPGDLALFAFFGHGRTCGNEHCLLTKDSRLDSTAAMDHVLRIGDLKRISDACGAERVFLLDCCRDSSRGRSQEHDEPSPAAAPLPGPAETPGPVTTIFGDLRGGESAEIPALKRGLLTTAFLTVAQRRMSGRLAIQIDDDFMEECRGVLRGLGAEHELSTLPALVRYGSEGHRPILVEGRMPLASASIHESNDITRRCLTNSLSMKLACIPAGTFMMGSPAAEGGPKEDETQHEVTLTKAFFLGITQVTQEQWQALMGNNPSFFRGVGQLPVENVSWDDAVEFCERLSQKEGRRYRLPTEAEWEYACRAGTTTPFSTGMTITTTQANFGIYEYDGEPVAPHLRHTAPVGSYAANAFGLYDMHGNVYEWCSNWFGDYPTEAVTDPKGPDKRGWRVIRGGCCHSGIMALRSANRYFRGQEERYRLTGFRVAMDAE